MNGDTLDYGELARTYSVEHGGCIVYVTDGKACDVDAGMQAIRDGWPLDYVFYPRSQRSRPRRNGRLVTVAEDVRAAEAET